MHIYDQFSLYGDRSVTEDTPPWWLLLVFFVYYIELGGGGNGNESCTRD